MLMEPADTNTKDLIYRDAIRIVKKDPRVVLMDVSVTDHDDAILVQVDILYHTQNVKESLYITYQLTTIVDESTISLLQE